MQRAIRVISSPAGIVVLLVTLIVDALSLDRFDSIVGRFIDRRVLHDYSKSCGGFTDAWFVDIGNSYEVDFELDRSRSIVQKGWITADLNERESGFWGLTRGRIDPTLNIWLEEPVSDEVFASIRAQFADHIAIDDPDFGKLIRDDAGPQMRTLWLGWVHDGFAATVALLLIVGISCNMLSIARECRTRGFKASGRCMSCGYDLYGQPDLGCPECGRGRDSTPT